MTTLDARQFSTVAHAGTVADPWPGSAIQSALNALPATGGTVMVADGVWRIDSPLQLNTSNFSLVGQSQNAQLMITGAGQMWFGSAGGVSNATISNLTINANTATLSAMRFTNAQNLSLSNNQILGDQNGSIPAVFFEGGSNDQILNNAITAGRGGGGVLQFQTLGGTPNSGFVISQNTFDSGNLVLLGLNNSSVTNNYFSNKTLGNTIEIMAGGPFTGTSQNITIDGNTLDATVGSPANGAIISGVPNDPGGTSNINGLSITNNILKGTTSVIAAQTFDQNALNADTAIGNKTNVTITGNQLSSLWAGSRIDLSGGTYGSVDQVVVESNTLQNSAGQQNVITQDAHTTNATILNNSLTGATGVDTVTPTVMVSTNNTDVNVAHNTATITFSFSQAPTDFSLSNTSAVGGTLSNLSGSGTVYSATFTAAANTDISNAKVSVNNSWHGVSGNAGASANSSTFVVDTVTPTVTVSTNNTDVNVAHNTATITFTFSEAPTDFSLSNTSAVGGTLSNLSGSGTVYSATFTAAANTDISNAKVSVNNSWHEANGNAGASANSSTFVVDTVTPTVTPSVTVSTNNTDVNVAHNTATITFTFSEAPTDFSLSNTSAVGGTLSNLSGSGTVYSATFTAAANTDISNAKVSVNNSWHGVSGNAGASANSSTFVVDTVTPTVTVSTNNTDVNVAHNTATITFTFSEAPTDFSLSNTSAVGGTLSNLSGSGTVYSATFTAAANTDISNAKVSVNNSWHEANGNAGASANSSPFVVDTVTPSVVTLNNITANAVFANETVIVQGSVSPGVTVTLDNARLVIEGGAAGATINMRSGIDAVDLTSIAAGATGNPTITNFSSGDQIGVKGATGATFTAKNAHLGTVSFSGPQGAAGTIAVSNKTINLTHDALFPLTSQTVGGVTFTVATLDPPTKATGATGAATGASGHAVVGASSQHHVTVEKVLGRLDKSVGFLNHSTQPAATVGPVASLFTAMAPELTNLFKGLGPWITNNTNTSVSGLLTQPNTSSVGNLEQVSKPHTHDLLPPHH